MEIREVPFKIPFPIRIFDKSKVNFENRIEREELFKRNIYFRLGLIQNPLPNERWKLFLFLANNVRDFLKDYNIDILSISIFGSALHSSNNDDYDFLVIVKGNFFDNIKTKIDFDGKEYLVGISLKGKDNFVSGLTNKISRFERSFQKKIINRTSISLPYRHIPLLGFDFKENKIIFLDNCYAQVYDLLINTYKTYYIRNKKGSLPPITRARKILSRIFEASRYVSIVSPSGTIELIQKKIFSLKESRNYRLKETKHLFREFVSYYNALVKED